ncbi:MAG TPA: glycosyltransferase [Actinomycetota bacterium]|nr:glycosyltransferase [Actinomycetota bacterium]
MQLPSKVSTSGRVLKRAAMVAMHSSPLEVPGRGDAGGMSVYVRKLASALSARGIEVDVFTRSENGVTKVVSDGQGSRVIFLPAGPAGTPKEQMPGLLGEFTDVVTDWTRANGESYDVLHSHYWLSGQVALQLGARWHLPVFHTFHTLARVKNGSLVEGDAAEPEVRASAEDRVVANSGGIIASTNSERDSLVDLYSADPSRIHLVSPGVDHSVFKPGRSRVAKQIIGVGDRKVLLFAGRLQPLKSADTAVRALAGVIKSGDFTVDQVRLLIVGGSSGLTGSGEPSRLRDLANALGVSQAVEFWPAQAQEDLAVFYQAADVCIVPSRSESFGLVALEAMATGRPVVASGVGGLVSLIDDGVNGFLVDPGDSSAFTERIRQLLTDPGLADEFGRAGGIKAQSYSWDRAADRVTGVYRGELS